MYRQQPLHLLELVADRLVSRHVDDPVHQGLVLVPPEDEPHHVDGVLHLALLDTAHDKDALFAPAGAGDVHVAVHLDATHSRLVLPDYQAGQLGGYGHGRLEVALLEHPSGADECPQAHIGEAGILSTSPSLRLARFHADSSFSLPPSDAQLGPGIRRRQPDSMPLSLMSTSIWADPGTELWNTMTPR
eukprot:CAMPEP_0173364176 /NCGR_PEP_ID=MMETSP1144-20121109/22823_1 /TAXON_ID=483371 /ORGANISM="non described non described, Strain CCMP2298" /LENGTH=187 /DNA_ID=CAMNT_0014314263 /DNA_START=123 /DNA_END=687 /DNA_ORIENTATION=+